MWLIYKSSGSEKKQEAATRSIPEETEAEVSRDSMSILMAMSLLCSILYGAIYHFRNPGQDIEKVKNRVVITFSIVFFGALVIIRLAQIINA